MIIAVDFDGTLCTNKYPQIGEPNKQLFQILINKQKAGDIIILNTCRHGIFLEQAIDKRKRKSNRFVEYYAERRIIMTEREAVNYFNNATIDTSIGVEDMFKTSALINISISALEKQIPKKINVINSIHYHCPSCDLYFDSRDWKSKYCGRCGQAIKWE